jgi:6-phosphogluconate dehydrogenase
MNLGIVGLGRMGANMGVRLVRGGHHVVAFDPDVKARGAAGEGGVATVASLRELLEALPTPRVVWVMVPAGDITEVTLDELRATLQPRDTVIEGGNSNYKDSQRRAKSFAGHGIDYIDCGTSGGVWGLENGYSLMIGGGEQAIERCRPIFETLAPGKDRGWGRVGGSGAGHFAKMIHNGIEYGLMQAYAEGFAILEKKEELGIDLHQVSEIWQHGSVVRSWLLELISRALSRNPGLEGIAPFVSDSGEGRWTVQEAVDLDVAAPVITLALLQRLASREPDSYSDKLLAAMRQQFGGHAIKPTE